MKETPPFTIYNASAGSGKTFTLVKNYLCALFTASRKDFYKNILAITFTNKAVAEMKTRIIDSLRAFSELPIDASYINLFEAVKSETNLSDARIQEKAHAILKNLLHNYAAFEISTIDSFTHRILRTFAKDLEIPLNFEVELDTESILNEAVERLIAKAGTDKELTSTLIDFAISKTDDDKSWDISKDLNEIAKVLVNENNLTPLSALSGKSLADFNAFSKKLKTRIKSLKEQAQQQAEQFFKLIETHGLTDKDFTAGYIPKYFKKIQTLPILKAYPTGTKWQLGIASEPLYNKTQTPDKKALIDNLQAEIASFYKVASTAIINIDFLKRVQKKTSSLSLLKAIEQEVEKIKTERNLILISDFNNKISKSIQHQPAPFIYERLGERYHDYFIDEFQDTSTMQWSNLVPLIYNSVSSLTREGRPGNVTLVGDAKQSIYRWRGGKAEQFIGLSQHQNPFQTEKRVATLPANYRSKPEIVNFNNRFFKHISSFLSFDVYKDLYENAAQTPTKENGGYVQLNFIEAQNKAEEEEKYAEEVFLLIQDLETKGFEKKDICILVRKKKEGYVIANYLSEKGVAIISSESLLVKQSPSVNFLNHLLALSVNPEDKHLKFAVLDFLYTQKGLTESYFLFMEEKLALTTEAFFNSLQKIGIYFSLEVLQRLPLYDAIEYSIRSFGLSENQGAHLQFYLDFVYEYTLKNVGGIIGFLAHWKTKEDSLSIVAPEGENAVQIMTIHTSKGLEFPIVIYPFANEQIDDTRMDNLWVELQDEPNDIPLAYISAAKNMLDYGEQASIAYQELLIHKELDTFNLFYVAMTRAKEQLYLFSKYDVDRKGNEKHNTLSGLLISFLKEHEYWNNSLSYSFGSIPSAGKIITESTNPIPEASTFLSSAPSDHQIALVTKSGALWGTSQEQSIEQGSLIHELLAELVSREDIQKVISNAVNTGLILAENKDFYKHQLESIITHPELSIYFSNTYTVYTEKEIISQGKIIRLDRLCLKEQAATIIDYKTGAFSPSHIAQVNAYAEAIQEMGFRIEKKLLVYLDDKVTVKNV